MIFISGPMFYDVKLLFLGDLASLQTDDNVCAYPNGLFDVLRFWEVPSGSVSH